MNLFPTLIASWKKYCENNFAKIQYCELCRKWYRKTCICTKMFDKVCEITKYVLSNFVFRGILRGSFLTAIFRQWSQCGRSRERKGGHCLNCSIDDTQLDQLLKKPDLELADMRRVCLSIFLILDQIIF